MDTQNRLHFQEPSEPGQPPKPEVIVPELTIIYDHPPNFRAIRERFGRAVEKTGVIFTYGAVVYFPRGMGAKLPASIYAHEGVHCHRQGDNPEAWWDKYLADTAFRYREEVVAHQVEFIVACDKAGRPERRRQAAMIAKRLASPLYGNMTTKAAAMATIKGPVMNISVGAADV